MAFERLADRPTAHGIPKPRGPVIAGGDNEFAVWTERGAADWSDMTP